MRRIISTIYQLIAKFIYIIKAIFNYLLPHKIELSKLIHTRTFMYFIESFNKINAFLAINMLLAVCAIYVFWDLPDNNDIRSYRPSITTRIYSADDVVIGEYAKENRRFISIHNVPDRIVGAFVSAEDKTFYNHHGFDYIGIMGAVVNNTMFVLGQSNSLVGASTITQQVVKNFLLSNSRTIRRKLREAVLTYKVEQAVDKSYIMELYLNEIYLGRGKYGIVMAAWEYFGKSLEDLSISEAAFLAALPKAPGYLDPIKRYKEAKSRRDWVINRMMIDGKITIDQAVKAIATPLKVKKKNYTSQPDHKYANSTIVESLPNLVNDEDALNITESGLFIRSTIDSDLNNYAYDALREGIINFDKRQGWRGSVKNLLTENLADAGILENTIPESNKPVWLEYLSSDRYVKQYKFKIAPWRFAIALKVNKESVEIGLLTGDKDKLELRYNSWAVEDRKGKLNNKLKDFNDSIEVGDVILVEKVKDRLYLRQIPDINGSAVAMDVHTGAVLAMQGGFSFNLSQFNRATDAKRQPGSLFKPFVYLTALQKGMSPTDNMLDAPFSIRSEDGTNVYTPTNYKNRYSGFVSLRNALVHSKNYVTLRLAYNIGLSSISKLSKDFGIYDSSLPDITSAIGSYETTLLKMVNAYAEIANGGNKLTPFTVTQVEDRDGNTIYAKDRAVYNEYSNIYNWSNSLEIPDSKEESIRVADEQSVYQLISMMEGVVRYGSGYRARVANYAIAGKTGTTNDSVDIWFIGFTPDIVFGVYLGSDTPRSLGDWASGSNYPAYIFKNFMSKALSGYQSRAFEVPSGLKFVRVDSVTGEIVRSKKDTENRIVTEVLRDENLD